MPLQQLVAEANIKGARSHVINAHLAECSEGNPVNPAVHAVAALAVCLQHLGLGLSLCMRNAWMLHQHTTQSTAECLEQLVFTCKGLLYIL